VEDLYLLAKRRKGLLFRPVTLDFNLVKISSSFIKLLGFQLQVPRGSVMLSVKVALFRKKLLKEGVTVIKRVI